MTTTPHEVYKSGFDSLTRHTSEYEQSVDHILRQIIPALPGREQLLDVGAGSGNLSRPLAPLFARTHVVEPNPRYFEELVAWGRAAGQALDGHQGDWLEDPFAGPADLVLVSHVLYFVPHALRAAFVDKAYRAVRPGGYLVLALVSITSGISHLYRELLAPEVYAEMPSIEGLVVDLHARGYEGLRLTLFDAAISLPDKRSVDELVDFVVAGRIAFDTPEARARRDAYVERRLRADGGYAINSTIGLIAVKGV